MVSSAPPSHAGRLCLGASISPHGDPCWGRGARGPFQDKAASMQLNGCDLSLWSNPRRPCADRSVPQRPMGAACEDQAQRQDGRCGHHPARPLPALSQAPAIRTRIGRLLPSHRGPSHSRVLVERTSLQPPFIRGVSRAARQSHGVSEGGESPPAPPRQLCGFLSCFPTWQSPRRPTWSPLGPCWAMGCSPGILA